MNRIVGPVDQATRQSVCLAGKKPGSPWNKSALVPCCHSRRRSRLRHCREATKLRPRCLT